MGLEKLAAPPHTCKHHRPRFAGPDEKCVVSQACKKGRTPAGGARQRPANECRPGGSRDSGVALIVSAALPTTARPPRLRGLSSHPKAMQTYPFKTIRSWLCLFSMTALAACSAGAEHAAFPPWNENGKIGHQQLLEKAKSGKIDVYFMGDSITRRWGALDYPDFLAHWKKSFHGWNAADFGWGGDSTHNMLWRIQNGELDGIHPKVVVLLAGTNNIGDKPKPGCAEDAAEGVKALLDIIQAKAPEATIILLPIFPRNDNPESNKMVAAANKRIVTFADGKKIRLLNINDQLADKDGKLFEGMTVDNLHLSLKGYEVWAKNLKPILTELLGEPAAEDHAPAPTGDPSALKK